MFTRVVEGKCKPGKTTEFCNTIVEKVMPILKKQQGFQDEIVLVSTTDPSQVLMISFWNKREDAERYHREQFAKIAHMVRHLGDGDPVVKNYDVNTSTVHHIIQKAA
jgi:heme-degrading monooxygenase HmoA